MNVTAVLKIAGLGLRLAVFLIISLGLVYIMISVCFWCRANGLEKGLVTFFSIGLIAVLWLVLIVGPRP